MDEESERKLMRQIRSLRRDAGLQMQGRIPAHM